MREVIEILKKRIYAIAHAGVLIKINGIESMLTEIKGIEEASLEIEALLPKPISVKECGLPKEKGWYVTWIKNEADPNEPYILNDVWFDGEHFVRYDYIDSGSYTANIKYYMRDSELLKLLPKGE